jgi:hypothetical protein
MFSNIIKGGVAHMVERSLRMREARGSIPRTSIFYFLLFRVSWHSLNLEPFRLQIASNKSERFYITIKSERCKQQILYHHKSRNFCIITKFVCAMGMQPFINIENLRAFYIFWFDSKARIGTWGVPYHWGHLNP